MIELIKKYKWTLIIAFGIYVAVSTWLFFAVRCQVKFEEVCADRTVNATLY